MVDVISKQKNKIKLLFGVSNKMAALYPGAISIDDWLKQYLGDDAEIDETNWQGDEKVNTEVTTEEDEEE